MIQHTVDRQLSNDWNDAWFQCLSVKIQGILPNNLKKRDLYCLGCGHVGTLALSYDVSPPCTFSEFKSQKATLNYTAGTPFTTSFLDATLNRE